MNFLQNFSPVVGALLIFFTLDQLCYGYAAHHVDHARQESAVVDTWLFQIHPVVVVMGAVLDDLDNVLKVVAYAGGFATGNVVGMLIEKRLAIGYSHISIISRGLGKEIAQALRAHDFAVTEIPAYGRDGKVTLLNCSVQRKLSSDIEKLALEQDPEAFITIEDVVPRQRGYWGRTGINR